MRSLPSAILPSCVRGMREAVRLTIPGGQVTLAWRLTLRVAAQLRR